MIIRMKKLQVIFFVSLFLIFPVYPENGIFKDSTLTPIQIDTKIKNIDSLFSISSSYIGIDNEIAILYINKGRQLLNDVKYKPGILNYYLLMARIAYYDDAYDTAIIYFDSIKTIINFDVESPELAQYYSLNGVVQNCLGDYQKAIEWMLNSVQVREILGDFSGMAMNYNGIGNLYLEQNDLTKAEEYFQRAFSLNKQTSDAIGKGNILINFGKLKEKQDGLSKAMGFYTDAHDLFVENGGLRGIAASLFKIAQIQTEWEDYQKAISNLFEAEEIYLKLDEKYGLTYIYNQISKTYRLEKKYDLALKYGKLANTLAKQINSEPLLAESYLQLSEIHKALGDFENSLVTFKAYEKLNTELISWENNKKLLSLENQAKIVVQEKDIKILSQENQLRKILMYFSIACTLVLLLITSGIIRYQRLKNNNLYQKKEILEEKNKVFEIENQLHEQNQKMLKNDLELKNKELASKALALLQLNEALQDVGVRVNEIKSGKTQTDKNAINSIVQEIKMATHSNIWEEFDLAFNNVYNSFYDKLLKICPDLTSTEIKMAALLKLNLSTKEIAAITFKTESAIKIARHRIRNKLKLDSNENLISFLLKLN